MSDLEYLDVARTGNGIAYHLVKILAGSPTCQDFIDLVQKRTGETRGIYTVTEYTVAGEWYGEVRVVT